MWDLVSSLRLQGLALGPGENLAHTRGRADKPWGTGSPKRINPINWGSDPTPIFTLLPILSNLHATNALSWILRNNRKEPKIRPKISWNCCKNVVKILWIYHFSSSLIVFEFKSENTYFYYLRKLDVIRFYVSKSFYNEYLYKI